jgi:hypothetical protein
MKPVPGQRLDKHVTANNNPNMWRSVFSVVRAEGFILKTTGATQAVSDWQFPSKYQTLRTDQQQD